MGVLNLADKYSTPRLEAVCRNLTSTKFIRLPQLLTDLEIARGDGSYKRVLNQYKKYELLIFISQFAPTGRPLSIGEGTIADAVLDRIVHRSYEILIDGQGDSWPYFRILFTHL